MTGLPFNNGYNAVLLVVDWLIKKRHYIPYIINKNGTTAEATTYLLLNNI